MTNTFLKLRDGTEIKVEAGTLKEIYARCESREAALSLAGMITRENVEHVEIIVEQVKQVDGDKAEVERIVTGIYENLIGEVALAVEDNTDGSVTCRLSLKEKDRTEARLESLEESTELLTSAILS